MAATLCVANVGADPLTPPWLFRRDLPNGRAHADTYGTSQRSWLYRINPGNKDDVQWATKYRSNYQIYPGTGRSEPHVGAPVRIRLGHTFASCARTHPVPRHRACVAQLFADVVLLSPFWLGGVRPRSCARGCWAWLLARQPKLLHVLGRRARPLHEQRWQPMELSYRMM